VEKKIVSFKKEFASVRIVKGLTFVRNYE